MFEFFKKENNLVIHVNDLVSLIGKIELIDIREPYEYKSGSLKDKTYYIMCQSGARSGRATKLLKKQGYQVVNVAGDMGSYLGTKRK